MRTITLFLIALCCVPVLLADTTLYLDATQSCAVFIDGKFVGYAPVVLPMQKGLWIRPLRVKLAQGLYEVEFMHRTNRGKDVVEIKGRKVKVGNRMKFRLTVLETKEYGFHFEVKEKVMLGGRGSHKEMYKYRQYRFIWYELPKPYRQFPNDKPYPVGR